MTSATYEEAVAILRTSYSIWSSYCRQQSERSSLTLWSGTITCPSRPSGSRLNPMQCLKGDDNRNLLQLPWFPLGDWNPSFFCQQLHYSSACKVVTQVESRKDILRKSGRSFNYLRCSKCGERRHAVICTYALLLILSHQLANLQQLDEELLNLCHSESMSQPWSYTLCDSANNHFTVCQFKNGPAANGTCSITATSHIS